MYQFIKSFLDNKMSIFEGYGAFKERSAENFIRGASNDTNAIFSNIIKASVVGTHLNCLDLSRQFK